MKRDNSYIDDEFRKNMSKKLLGNKNALGHKVNLSKESRLKISLKLLGIKRSAETREKMSKAQKGRKISEVSKLNMSLAAIKRHNKPWKSLNYSQIHNRIRRMFGVPRICEKCKDTNSKYYDWSNISLKYKRSRSDWKRLCRKCHGRHDSEKRGNKRRGVSLKSSINRRNNGKNKRES